MVLDKDTDKVYFSELLSTDSRYSSAYHRICALLEKHRIAHGLLQDTKDIWCRDYMPLQKSETEFLQFRYEPSYLKEDLHLQTDPSSCLASNHLSATFSNINLDGGNILRWTDRVILSERVFSENADEGKFKLIGELERLFEAEVILIPEIKSDMTGHADGLVRFVDKNTLIGNRLEGEYAYWRKGMRKVLSEHGLNYIDMPFLDHKVKGHEESAIGCYINYLEVGNLVIMPVFEVPGHRDEEALAILQGVFPDRIIETVNINEVGMHGGLLNCITWNIKTGRANS